MDPIIRKLTSIIIGPMLVFALFVVIYGHILPGEGFDGGILIASILILCMIVFGKEQTKKLLNLSVVLHISAAAALAMVAIGFIGLLGIREGHKFFFDNFLNQGDPHNLLSGGIVPICNCLLGIIVGTGFYSLFGYLVVWESPSQRFAIKSHKSRQNVEQSGAKK